MWFVDIQKDLKSSLQIKLLIEKKLIICALGNLHYKISREKFEPEPRFERWTSSLLLIAWVFSEDFLIDLSQVAEGADCIHKLIRDFGVSRFQYGFWEAYNRNSLWKLTNGLKTSHKSKPIPFILLVVPCKPLVNCSLVRGFLCWYCWYFVYLNLHYVRKYVKMEDR